MRVAFPGVGVVLDLSDSRRQSLANSCKVQRQVGTQYLEEHGTTNDGREWPCQALEGRGSVIMELESVAEDKLPDAS